MRFGGFLFEKGFFFGKICFSRREETIFLPETGLPTGFLPPLANNSGKNPRFPVPGVGR
jgi:hypothetical protein